VACHRLEGENDERVPGQHRERLAEGLVHRSLAAADFSIIEAGQVIMHKRGAVQELDGGRGTGDDRPGLRAAGFGDRHGEARANAGTARKNRIVDGLAQPGRAALQPCFRQDGLQEPLELDHPPLLPRNHPHNPHGQPV